MGILKNLLGKNSPPAQASDAPNKADLIEVFDQYGRKVFITRDQWRTNILPGNLKSNWNNADALYNIIVQSLNDGFRSDIVDAAKHLYAIDSQPMRGATIWGIVLMEENRLDEAEKIFRTYISTHGEDGIILTNLAKVYAKRNDTAKTEETLWHALELDPNQENGMGWYTVIHKERRGEKGYIEALERVAALPNSWRAQMWLARNALAAKNLDNALTLYRECLKRAPKPTPTDLLMQMSGDLGNAGYLAQIVELVEPHFDLAHHGLQVGNNLIKAHLTLGEIEPAKKLLEQLYSLKRPDWQETLSYWDTEIAKARLSPPTSDTIETSMLLGEGPVWLKPDSAGSELFPVDKAGAVKICFLGSSVEVDNASQQIEHQLADTRGRLSRAIPLFLAEQLHFHSNATAQTLVPWVSNGGFALVGFSWSDEDAAKYAAHSDYVITTHLKCQNEPWTLEIRIIRVIDHQLIGTLSGSFAIVTPESAIPAMSKDLLKLLQQQTNLKTTDAPLFYNAPVDSKFPYYLLRLEQLLAVRCGSMDGVKPGFLNGEREIINGNIQLCLDQPKNVTTRILLAKTLLAMKNVRADLLPEFKEKVTLLQKQHSLSEHAQVVVQKMFDEAFA